MLEVSGLSLASMLQSSRSSALVQATLTAELTYCQRQCFGAKGAAQYAAALGKWHGHSDLPNIALKKSKGVLCALVVSRHAYVGAWSLRLPPVSKTVPRICH